MKNKKKHEIVGGSLLDFIVFKGATALFFGNDWIKQ